MRDRVEYISAHCQLDLFRKKQLSPVEVLQAQIARIEEVNGQINAITTQHFDEALKAARESETRYQKGEARPLEGMSVAVEEEYGRQGWRMSAGSRLFKDEVAQENHPVIDKLLAAGAILHVQTTVPEFILTRNPWNPECTPGGSSGGSAAAVAGGMATVAIGSDMGGSIRILVQCAGYMGRNRLTVG